jgi:uncharacterized protein YgbK (DUF1537 family)
LQPPQLRVRQVLLRWAGSLGPGVPLLRVAADAPGIDGLELMLKGGRMGAPDVFVRLLDGMQGAERTRPVSARP